MSSTEPEAAAQAAPDVKPAAASSTADPGVQGSIADAVKAALKEPEVSPPSASGVEEPEPKTTEGEPVEEGKDPLDDEFQEPVSSRTQTRIRDLVARGKSLQAEVETFRPKAEQFDRLVSTIRERGVELPEVDNAIAVVALMKSDPAKALELLTPLVQDLAKRTGRVLPTDLQEEVRLGYISEARASELAQARAQATSAQQREQERQQREQQERVQREHNDRVTTVTRAADEWAKAKATSDPDWHAKQSLVAEAVELELLRRGPDAFPKNQSEAVALAEEAYKRVNQTLKTVAPKPIPRNPVTGEFASSRSAPEPTSLHDAVKQALRG